ncbi:MAG: hypothetical protein ACUVX8_12205 [Candidatus Zipacnadales bacterium]
MLVHFRCTACGADLVVQPDFAGRDIRCSVCRHLMTAPTAPPPVPAHPAVASTRETEKLAERIAEEAEADARRLAWVEARKATYKSRRTAFLLTVAGGLAVLGGSLTFWAENVLWIPRSSSVVTLVLGGVVLLIGITVWRFAVETTHEEFRRRLPRTADRLRRQYWEAYRGRSKTIPPHTAVGA